MDISLPVGGGAIAFMLIVFAAKKLYEALSFKFAEYDKHLEECNAKAINHARLEERFSALNEKVDDLGDKCSRMDEKLDRLIENM